MSFIQAKPTATYDLYGPIHKGLRMAITDVLLRIGRTEPQDATQVAATIAQVRGQLHISARHLHHEEQVIHAALEARCPGAAARLDHDHAGHEAAFAGIERRLQVIEAAQGDQTGLWRDLYLAFSSFVAADLAHMAEEEEVTQPLLQSLFTDEELAAIEQRILASIAPDEMLVFLGLMVGAGSPSGRLSLLCGVRANAPPQAFAHILDTAVRPRLPAPDWTDLIHSLGIAA